GTRRARFPAAPTSHPGRTRIMRRTLWLVPPAVAVLAAALFALKPSSSPAGPGQADPAKAAAVSPTSPSLPVTQAILYSSGVGYFQREGTVEGSARVDLTFP